MEREMVGTREEISRRNREMNNVFPQNYPPYHVFIQARLGNGRPRPAAGFGSLDVFFTHFKRKCIGNVP